MDNCPAYRRRGQSVKTQEVLVGYSCSRHSFIGGNGGKYIASGGGSSVRSEYTQAGNAIGGEKDCPEGTNIKAASDSALRSQLLAKFQKVMDTEEEFIPASGLDEVLTDHAIKEELRSHALGHFYSHVSRRAKRIFAILLIIRKLGALHDLIKEDMGDEFLPLAMSAINSPEDNKLGSVFFTWEIDTRKQLFELQWALLAPVFAEGSHPKLDDDVRLPFIKTEPIAKGAYGGVHCVEIHGDYERFEEPGSPMSRIVSSILEATTRGHSLTRNRVTSMR